MWPVFSRGGRPRGIYPTVFIADEKLCLHQVDSDETRSLQLAVGHCMWMAAEQFGG